MPYTLSHVIIALPISAIVKNKIPLASLVVGCIAPDFPYLLALTSTNAPGHSLLGVLIYCLFPSLIALFIWYRWLEKPALKLFHLPLRAWRFSPKLLLYTVLGVLIGSYSHVLWDATSHSYGAFVVGSEFWHKHFLSLPLYKWNQYGSGLLGLTLICFWYLYSVVKYRHEHYKGQLRLGILTYGLSILVFVFLANLIHGSVSLSEYAVRTAIGVIVGGFSGMLLYATLSNK